MNDINTSSGVDYNVLDQFKRRAQEVARETDSYAHHLGIIPFAPSRGESAFLLRNGDHFLAFVEEGLGTKNLVADRYKELIGGSFYGGIAQDTVAMIVNDMITVGALPFVISMHLAVGDSSFFGSMERTEGLLMGWKSACKLAGCTWGPGETPELQGIVNPKTVLLAGSAVGKTTKGTRWFDPSRIAVGDAIIFCESSGIHANGLTKARKIADQLKDGYLTKVSGTERYFGEMLLDATHIYVSLVELCLREEIDVHYAVNITGHGWRKLMRAPKPFTYVVRPVSSRSPIFDFIERCSGLAGESLTREDMYASYNMGAGFALYIAERDKSRFFRTIAREIQPYSVFDSGHIEHGRKRVVIDGTGIEFEGDTLQVR